MPKTAIWDSREKLAAAAAVALLHAAFIAALLYAMTESEERRASREHEITLVLVPREAARPPLRPRRRTRRPAAIAPDYNYRFTPPVAPADLAGLNLALTACAPENWSKLSPEQTEACRRIDIALAADPGAFGVHSDVKDAKRWARELQIKQSPPMLPCASPNVSAFGILNLGTVLCLADIVVNGYDPDKMEHYAAKPQQ